MKLKKVVNIQRVIIFLKNVAIKIQLLKLLNIIFLYFFTVYGTHYFHSYFFWHKLVLVIQFSIPFNFNPTVFGNIYLYSYRLQHYLILLILSLASLSSIPSVFDVISSTPFVYNVIFIYIHSIYSIIHIYILGNIYE